MAEDHTNGAMRGFLVPDRNLGRWIARLLRLTWWGVTFQLPSRWRKRQQRFDSRRAILSSPLFDAEWYVDRYPDVAAAGVDPALHFLTFGATESRNPGPNFDAAWYLAHNPDVAQAGINPLLHYLRFGASEGRRTSAVSESTSDGDEILLDLSIAEDRNGHEQATWRKCDVNSGVYTNSAPCSESNTNELPTEFDPVHYQAIHPDLRHMRTEGLAQHWIHYGIKEGRQGGRVADLYQFAALIPDNVKLLEIGPFNRPLKTGPHVRYFDVLDRDGLIQRAQKIGYETSRIPSKIDYVSAEADLGIVNEKFDFVLTCHAIEHQPNLVRHLMDVERLLEPGGYYFLVVPDKRFCFDHFMPETPLSLIIEAYINNHTRHSLHSVLEQRMLATHNDPLLHWQGNHGERYASPKIRYDMAMEQYRSAKGGYIDVHAWYFTPESFRETISALASIFPLSLTPIRIYPTRYSGLEFFAILRKTQPGQVN